MSEALSHPMQPLFMDGEVVRFHPNGIVRLLVEHGRAHGLGLNELACMDFPDEDRMQLAQLIGYSVSGWGELSYVTETARITANHMAERLNRGR